MRPAAPAVVALASIFAACGSGMTSPSPPPLRTTETISSTVTVLPSGVLVFSTDIPTMVVRERGLVDATVTFSPIADCQFVLFVCSATIPTACGTPAQELESPRGPGPTLAVSGVLAADTYHLGLWGRVGGVPLCSSVPPGGIPLTYTISVTHP